MFQEIVSDYLFYDIIYNKYEQQITIDKFYQTSLIAAKTGKYDCFTLFHGYIKNKSELKMILKMVKID